MKMLTKIESALTILVVASFVAMAGPAAWLTKMQFSDPTQVHPLMSRIGPIADIIFEVIFFSWLIFTVFYLIVLFIYLGSWLFCKLTGEDKK